MSKSLILNHEEISLKLDRIAWQILEHHYGEETIVLIGLVDRGSEVAEKIKLQLKLLYFSTSNQITKHF